MTITKGQLAERGLRLMGVNTRTSSASSEEVQDFLLYMEDWNATSNAIGKRIGWNFEEDPDPNSESGIQDWAHQGVYGSVACMVSPYYDRVVTPDMQRVAALGMQTITNETVEVQEYQYSRNMPVGTGYPWRTYSNRYYNKRDDIITDADFLEDEGGEVIYTNGSNDETTSS